MTAETLSRSQVGYLVLSVFTFLTGLMITAIFYALMPYPSHSIWAGFRVLVCAIATLSVISVPMTNSSIRSYVSWTSVVSSVSLVIVGAAFLIEIIPIARGNNDSGEIFWFIALPMILFGWQARSTYSRFLQPPS